MYIVVRFHGKYRTAFKCKDLAAAEKTENYIRLHMREHQDGIYIQGDCVTMTREEFREQYAQAFQIRAVLSDQQQFEVRKFIQWFDVDDNIKENTNFGRYGWCVGNHRKF